MGPYTQSLSAIKEVVVVLSRIHTVKHDRKEPRNRTFERRPKKANGLSPKSRYLSLRKYGTPEFEKINSYFHCGFIIARGKGMIKTLC
jgi:hypothetical protein